MASEMRQPDNVLGLSSDDYRWTVLTRPLLHGVPTTVATTMEVDNDDGSFAGAGENLGLMGEGLLTMGLGFLDFVPSSVINQLDLTPMGNQRGAQYRPR